ncbi:uncharacterized protein LOC120138594 [Hibiscus syriacus]|uniref:uncharacterized protein LOC120138594 n=1 Tax=Hibiscus syriacus TaxID=106335 RepID=UPI001920A704|nr:uncharacterized protein LOC120138594 [Hibiscus syriacus]
MNVSKTLKDDNMFKVLDNMVEEVEEKNVVQVVTNNASNYVKAGKLLIATRPNLYWTLCRAHCIDLMLEDIEKFPKVKNALKKCMFMNGYIYSHISLVNMMRRCDKGKSTTAISSHKVLVHDDEDEIEEDIGEDGDYGGDGGNEGYDNYDLE